MNKKKPSLLEKGFKAEAERISLDLRKQLGLTAFSKLCAFELAKHLRIKIRSIQDDYGFTDTSYSDWSACLIYNKNNHPVIIHNKVHTQARQQSDVMHEISHFYRKHPLPEQDYDFIVPTAMLSINPLYEEEASWLGGVLQLPRKALEWAIFNQKMTGGSIADFYTCSPEMVRYRVNVSGLGKYFKN